MFLPFSNFQIVFFERKKSLGIACFVVSRIWRSVFRSYQASRSCSPSEIQPTQNDHTRISTMTTSCILFVVYTIIQAVQYTLNLHI